MKWMYEMRTFHSQGDIILYDFLKCLKTTVQYTIFGCSFMHKGNVFQKKID